MRKTFCKQEKIVRLCQFHTQTELYFISTATSNSTQLKRNHKTVVITGPKKHSRGRLANTSRGFLFLFLGIAPCTVRVPKIINIRTKQNFASIALFSTKKKNTEVLFHEVSLDFPWKFWCRRIVGRALSYSDPCKRRVIYWLLYRTRLLQYKRQYTLRPLSYQAGSLATLTVKL